MGRLITGAGFTGTIGGNITVYGTPERQTITVADVAGTVTFDPSFNKGGDTIVLAKSAASYTIAQSGSTVVLSDGDSRIVIPVGTIANTIQFSDGDRALLFSGGVKIGQQAVTTTAATITATGTTKSTLAADAATQAARLVLSEESVSVGGNVMVYGTAGVESVLVVGKGKITFDPSFNKGGDILSIPYSASEVSAQRAGSAVLLKNENVQLTVPVGTIGATINFSGDTRSLKFADGAFKLGQSSVTADLTPVNQIPSALTKNHLKIGYYYDFMNSHMTDEDFDSIFRQAKEDGFGGIQFELTVSVDKNGVLQDPLGYDRLFKLVDRVHELGLDVSLIYNWCIGSDNAAYIDTTYRIDEFKISPDFPTKNLIDSIYKYFHDNAEKFNSHNIDYVLLFNSNAPEIFQLNKKSWQETFDKLSLEINALISVTFSPVSNDIYDYWDSDIRNSAYIYDHLDFVSLWVRWENQPIKNDNSTIDDNITAALYIYPSIYDEIKNLIESIDKPLILISNAFGAPNALDGGWDPYRWHLERSDFLPASDLQMEAFKTVLSLSRTYFSDYISAYVMGNVEPWGLAPNASTVSYNWSRADLTRLPEELFNFFADFNFDTSMDRRMIYAGSLSLSGGDGDDRIILADPQYVVRFNFNQWFGSKSDGVESIDISVNGGVSTSRLNVNAVGKDQWYLAEGRVYSNKPISGLTITIDPAGQFIDFIDTIYTGPFQSQTLTSEQGVRAKGLTADWAKKSWILNGDGITFTFSRPNAFQEVSLFGGAGVDEVILSKSPYVDQYFRLTDIEVVSDPNGAKVVDALPRSLIIYLDSKNPTDLSFLAVDAIISPTSKIKTSLEGGKLTYENSNKYAGYDYLDAILIENGVRWETRLIFVVDTEIETHFTYASRYDFPLQSNPDYTITFG